MSNDSIRKNATTTKLTTTPNESIAAGLPVKAADNFLVPAIVFTNASIISNEMSVRNKYSGAKNEYERSFPQSFFAVDSVCGNTVAAKSTGEAIIRNTSATKRVTRSIAVARNTKAATRSKSMPTR